MKINRINALSVWANTFDDAEFAEDFHGNLMCRKAYGNADYFIRKNGEKIYCGWNLHHILPKRLGGKNSAENLVCTNFITNAEAADKITYWIEDRLYQVRKIYGTNRYKIVILR